MTVSLVDEMRTDQQAKERLFPPGVPSVVTYSPAHSRTFPSRSGAPAELRSNMRSHLGVKTSMSAMVRLKWKYAFADVLSVFHPIILLARFFFVACVKSDGRQYVRRDLATFS
ncbi:predicted protein [Coccidioides posadasii str. Silveira]|uniref:Predicted protein n=2 Tax=Coccidioides posadasii TaxID=199306 RepID=E9D1S4_COCPS|nr:predicted protein [Coccidioides posadasii str. Silveira]KMM72197.1 hypothetical protein CPAG_08496 [Coccidioides posadasii RMSCC 3488]